VAIGDPTVGDRKVVVPTDLRTEGIDARRHIGPLDVIDNSIWAARDVNGRNVTIASELGRPENRVQNVERPSRCELEHGSCVAPENTRERASIDSDEASQKRGDICSISDSTFRKFAVNRNELVILSTFGVLNSRALGSVEQAHGRPQREEERSNKKHLNQLRAA
jgi:hypothetical protein